MGRCSTKSINPARSETEHEAHRQNEEDFAPCRALVRPRHRSSKGIPSIAFIARKTMSIVIVGGDSVDSLKKLLQAEGVRVIGHWSGRKKRDIRKPIPKGTQAVVLVLDRVNHALARHVRKESARLGVPVLFQRR
ncbi:MAG: hypothetical protein C4294_02505, partial [Nitrospiraceae bacterium]